MQTLGTKGTHVVQSISCRTPFSDNTRTDKERGLGMQVQLYIILIGRIYIEPSTVSMVSICLSPRHRFEAHIQRHEILD
jgi:hypothetical protein